MAVRTPEHCLWISDDWHHFCDQKKEVIYLWGCWNCDAREEYYYCRKHFNERCRDGKLLTSWCHSCKMYTGEWLCKVKTN